MKSRWIIAVFLLSALTSLPGLKGQDEPQAPPPPPMVRTNVFFISFAGPGLNGKTVTGAPYSAVQTTETIQTLSDGNRIDRKNSANLYRDSEGRVRSERTLRMIGPWAASGTPPTLITINDPVAGTRYLLNQNKKTAYKMPLKPHHLRTGVGYAENDAGGQVGGQVAITQHPDLGPGIAIQNPDLGPGIEIQRMVAPGPEGEPQTESLGTQMISGVEAQGTRVTRTIAAGKIGNEKPITITSERWYSPDLQLYIMVKQDDPRMGQTVVQLTNIKRAEPDPSLFQVPADYTVKDGPPRKDALFPFPHPNAAAPPPPPDQNN